MPYHPEIPYNDLPLLPPKAEIETKVILKKTITASRALSELKGAITNLPNPALFIDTIQLQEAQASSAIENIVTTQDELFRSTVADKKPDNPAVKEVLHYKDALWHGLEIMKTKPVLSTNLFLELVRIVKENDAGIRNMPGTRLTNPATGKVIYTPPEGEGVIQEKLKNLEEFIHADDGLDPLVKMAVMHYQFEAIHPFFDGNGRTGRIILLLFLIWKGLLELPALFLSGFIIKNKSAYYQKLLAVTEHNDWQGWILYMLEIIELSAGRDRRRISQIERVMGETGVKIREKLPKLYTKDLMEVLFRLPYTKRRSLVAAGIGNPKTAGNYLNELEQAGFLKSERVGKEKLYLNHALLNIIRGDEY